LKKVLFFSNNNNKTNEVRGIFNKSKLKILSLDNFSKIKEPKENGKSFAENSKIKSIYGYKKFGIPCFSDDSGICISALKNKPGVNSKFFLNKFKTNDDAFKYIINKTKSLNDSKAYFVTSICLTLKLGHYILFEGKICGNIADNPKGYQGFGYDPIFIPNGQKKTFAEMGTKRKNIISHRGLAINKLKNFLSV